MRSLVAASIGVALMAGCSLLVDTETLSTDSLDAPDAGAQIAPDADGVDAALAQDASADANADASADANADAGTRTFSITSTSDMIRISGSSPELPATEVNAGLGTNGGARRTGLRFGNVQLPRGVTIESAHVLLVSAEDQAGNATNTALFLEVADNALPWTGTVANYDQRARTGLVPWKPLPAWATGTGYETPELAPVFQQIVDRPGWAPGNAVVVFWEDDGSVGSAQQRVALASAAPPTAPSLTIRFR